MTSTTDLGLSIRLSMFELRETGDWDVFLGPPERTRAETGGADQWVSKRREFPGFARVNKVSSASLGYPQSVFNINSTLKQPMCIPDVIKVLAVWRQNKHKNTSEVSSSEGSGLCRHNWCTQRAGWPSLKCLQACRTPRHQK